MKKQMVVRLVALSVFFICCLAGCGGGGGKSGSNVSNPQVTVNPPSAPSNLRATATSSSTVLLTWNSSSDDVGVKEYVIYCNGQRLRTTPETLLSITGLNPSTEYLYRVSAVNTRDMESEKCQAVSVKTWESTPAWASIGHVDKIALYDEGGVKKAVCAVKELDGIYLYEVLSDGSKTNKPKVCAFGGTDYRVNALVASNGHATIVVTKKDPQSSDLGGNYSGEIFIANVLTNNYSVSKTVSLLGRGVFAMSSSYASLQGENSITVAYTGQDDIQHLATINTDDLQGVQIGLDGQNYAIEKIALTPNKIVLGGFTTTLGTSTRVFLMTLNRDFSGAKKYIYDPDPSPSRMYKGDNLHSFSLTPDGKHVFFCDLVNTASGSQSTLVRFDLQTESFSKISDLGFDGNAMASLENTTIDSDGKIYGWMSGGTYFQLQCYTSEGLRLWSRNIQMGDLPTQVILVNNLVLVVYESKQVIAFDKTGNQL